jgi:hypothetical protein
MSLVGVEIQFAKFRGIAHGGSPQRGMKTVSESGNLLTP